MESRSEDEFRSEEEDEEATSGEDVRKPSHMGDEGSAWWCCCGDEDWCCCEPGSEDKASKKSSEKTSEGRLSAIIAVNNTELQKTVQLNVELIKKKDIAENSGEKPLNLMKQPLYQYRRGCRYLLRNRGVGVSIPAKPTDAFTLSSLALTLLGLI